MVGPNKPSFDGLCLCPFNLTQISAIGFGIVFVISPVWIGETVRPELRGLFLCITNGSIVLGQFILSCVHYTPESSAHFINWIYNRIVAYGAGKIEGKWSYQMMVILQFAFVFFLLIGYPFFPESPYYLLKKNNEEKATSSLRRIHGNADPGFIEAEVSRLQEVIRVGQNLEAAAGMDGRPFIQCFKGANLVSEFIISSPQIYKGVKKEKRREEIYMLTSALHRNGRSLPFSQQRHSNSSGQPSC